MGAQEPEVVWRPGECSVCFEPVQAVVRWLARQRVRRQVPDWWDARWTERPDALPLLQNFLQPWLYLGPWRLWQCLRDWLLQAAFALEWLPLEARKG